MARAAILGVGSTEVTEGSRCRERSERTWRGGRREEGSRWGRSPQGRVPAVEKRPGVTSSKGLGGGGRRKRREGAEEGEREGEKEGRVRSREAHSHPPQQAARAGPRCVSKVAALTAATTAWAKQVQNPPLSSLAPKHSGSHPLHCASPVPAPSGKRLRLLWTDNWPARPEVGGAFRHRVAVYSKGWGVPPEPISPHWAGVSVLDDLSVGRSDCTSFCRRPPAPSSAGGRGGGGKSGSPGAAGAPAGAAVC
ncbi:uncharacterized protein ACOB8E_024819 isoform 2-T2 [Sarcophilus harrisii]